MVIFIILNLFVIFSARIIIKRFFNNFHILDKILIGFSIALAQIVLSEQILGVFSILTLLNLIITNFLIFLLLIIFCRRGISQAPVGDRMEINFSFSEDKVVLFGFSILAGFVVVKVFLNLINPPFGWDSLNYHLTFPVEWLKHKNFYTPITINDDPTPSYYPINGGLFYLWLILPFKNVYLADIGQLPFYIISLIAVFAIARRIGLDKKISYLATIIFGIIPNFMKELEIAYSDIMMACIFLLAVYSLLVLRKKFRWSIFSLSVVNLGLLLGTKTAGLPYVGILVMYLLYLLIKNKGIKKSCYGFILLLVGLIIFGGYGYIRNYILTGNPFYPLDVIYFGKRIFKGVVPISSYRAHWGPYDFNYKKLFFSEGLGAQFLILIFPSMFLAPVLAVKKRKFQFIFILPLLLFLTFRYVIPQLWVRFLYPYLGIGTVVGFWVLNQMNLKQKVLDIICLLFILTSVGEIAGHMELICGLIISIIIFIASFMVIKYNLLLKINPRIYILCFIMIIVALIIGERFYLDQEYLRYVTDSPYPEEETLAWKYLNDIIPEEGANIAYVGRPLPFPLYGTRFKNNVFYVSVNEKEPFLHSYENSYYRWTSDYNQRHKMMRENGNYRGNASYDIWLKNLKAKNTNYLFIYALHEITSFPMEDDWAKSHPEVFHLIFSNSLVHIYKINKQI